MQDTVLGIGIETKMSRKDIHCLMKDTDLQTNTISDLSWGPAYAEGRLKLHVKFQLQGL